MESYSHLGINQQMNHTNGESAFCLVFSNITFFIPTSKGKSIHIATSIGKFMGDVPSSH